MDENRDLASRLATMVLPAVGRLAESDDPWEPYALVDPTGVPVEAVGTFFRELQAAGRAAATARSYGMDLLRWFRFLWAIDVAWDRATRVEARDFCRWLLVAGKPARPHWRDPDGRVEPRSAPEPYAPSVRAHCETVLRRFYDFHLGSGPVINPFPMDRSRRGRRAHAHHNPMEPYRRERTGLYRPVAPSWLWSRSSRRSRSAEPGWPGSPLAACSAPRMPGVPILAEQVHDLAADDAGPAEDNDHESPEPQPRGSRVTIWSAFRYGCCANARTNLR